jgi:hypothetical protein
MRGVDLRPLGTYPLMKPVFNFGLYSGTALSCLGIGDQHPL